MIDREQEPYIASKLGGILERNSFKVVEEVTRDAFLSKQIHHYIRDNNKEKRADFVIHHFTGRKDKVNREFLWDMVNIFKGAQPFLAEKLGITEAEFPTFLEKFCAECKKTVPEEAIWTITIYISQKLPLS